MFGESHTIGATGGTRLTLRATEAGAEPRALVLEVLLTSQDSHTCWVDALTGYEKRFELLHGELLLDGVHIAPGARAAVPAGRRTTLANAGSGEAHFVCDLKPAGDPTRLLAALEHALSRAEHERGRRRCGWRGPAALALCAAVLFGLATSHRPHDREGGRQGSQWAQHLHLGTNAERAVGFK